MPRGSAQRQAGIALAGDRRVDALAEPGVLHEERRKREAQEHDREHGGAALVVRGADDGEEDLRRQHLEIAAEHERVAEIRHALDEAEQEGVGEPRPHQRQRDGAERRPALRPQGLRRLLERGADALHDADQDQEGDRREGEELRDEDAGQAVDPARARHAEPLRQRRRRRAGAAEEQDQRQADDERRGDDRQHRQDPQRALVAEIRPRRDEREGEAEHGRPDADQHGEEERVPGDPAAQAAAEAVEPPDRALDELGEERRRGEAAGIVLEGAGEDRRHREEHEDRDQRDDEGDRGDDEDIAAAPGPRREAVAEQHQEGEPDERRAEAHAALARPRRAEETGEPSRAPAAMPDGEALDDEPGEAEKAGKDEPPRRRLAVGADEERQCREAERNQERQEPRGPPGKPEPKPAPGLAERIAGKTGDEIPGQHRIAEPGERQPDARGPAHRDDSEGARFPSPLRGGAGVRGEWPERRRSKGGLGGRYGAPLRQDRA